jgi:hypothetical protein
MSDRMNFFQLLAVLIWTAYANRNSKILCRKKVYSFVNFVYLGLVAFKLFDFDNNGAISYEEMMYMFRSTCKGFGRATHTQMPSREDMVLVANKTFHSADLNSDQILELKE